VIPQKGQDRHSAARGILTAMRFQFTGLAVLSGSKRKETPLL
jgi:hypothetical protein